MTRVDIDSAYERRDVEYSGRRKIHGMREASAYELNSVAVRADESRR